MSYAYMEILNINDIEMDEYLHDESRLGGKAELIVFARNKADIEEAVEYCLHQRLPLTIQGSRTGITGGSVPDGGLILNLEKMDKITGIRCDEEGNYYLRCEPGLKLIELRKVLEKREYDISRWSEADKQVWKEFVRSGRYFFPPDPTETTASLGGMASCNASGARSYKYGATRRWISRIITVNVQDPDGLSVSGGELRSPQRGVKNAAGYYMQDDARDIDIYIGAEGTLGIIAEVEIRLVPKPAFCWGFIQFFREESDAMSFCRELKLKEYKASAIEYFDHNALALLRDNKQLWESLPELNQNWKYAVYCEFEGDDRELLEEAVFAAGDLAEEYGSGEADCWFVDNERGVEQLKEFRHAVPEAINQELDKLRRIDPRISKISTDLALPDGKLDRIVTLYREAEEQGWRIIVFGHLGNDHLHTNILPENYDKWLAGKNLVSTWAEVAVELGGSVSGEHGIGKTKRELLKLMYGSEGVAAFRKIKLEFDPAWILNRGNIIEPERIETD